MVVYDTDGDGRLSLEEFEVLYGHNVVEPVEHVWEDVVANLTSWASTLSVNDPNATNVFEGEGEEICLNSTNLFAVYEEDLDGYLNRTEVFGASAHLALINSFCAPAHEELPLYPHCIQPLLIDI